ncbi:T9SS type A sorting domain-containing protein [Aequorivita echinoideorum]|uniref:T9SS type A sorting domain-containing protein n=1 Tax=Aequorivita echinoideorum TaxID=1549647 RepID=A0ABS5S576_9FLAO|nr:T9SS type A sorting domain-containing protein [Aequorivita echinoideorum]MBT0608376.1 T9SS type A sorting domain-containing protein [Aequorivita echinoideorum]
MKTKLSLFIVLLSLPFLTLAQQPWQWAKRGGSASTQQNGTAFREEVVDMATDPNGNVYMVSNIGGDNLSVDGTTLDFHFPGDNFGNVRRDATGGLLMSYDCEGNFRWSKLVSGSLDGRILGVETDTLGHVYITAGVFPATKDVFGTEYRARFDTDTIIPYSANERKYKQRAYLVKYDTLGTMKNLRTYQQDSIHIMETSWTTNLFDFMVDPNGDQHLYIQARNYTAQGTDYFPVAEGDTLSPGDYILRYDAQDNYLGNIKLDMELENDFGGGFAPKINHDPVRKSYYMSGYNTTPRGSYEDSLWIGGQLVNSHLFVAKFDSLGNSTWLKQGNAGISPISNRFDEKPQIDSQGNIYLAGIFDNSPTYPSVIFNGYTGHGLNYSTFPVLLKMDSYGNLITGTHAVADNSVSLKQSIALNGNIIEFANSHAGITWGGFSFPLDPNSGYDAYLARFDARTGAIISMDSIASNRGFAEYPTAIATDRRGNTYIGGEFQGRMFAGGDTLTNVHYGVGTDYFLVKAGADNCGCALPEAAYAHTGTGGTVDFAYTGTMDYDTLEWGFDDGTVQTTTTNTINHTFTEAREHWVCVTAYNACGHDTWCSLIDPFGLATDVLEKGSFSLYPNPVGGALNIDAQEPMDYVLYDLGGKRLMEGRLQQGNNTLDTSALQSGFYMLRLKNGAGAVATVKVVRE